MAAVGLWNNMLQPVGKKATTWRIGEDIICPSEEQPYIFTSKNSK
jgi:phospholipase B1